MCICMLTSSRYADYGGDRYMVEPRRSSRVIEYVEEPRRRSRSVVRDVRDVDVRRSVERVRY